MQISAQCALQHMNTLEHPQYLKFKKHSEWEEARKHRTKLGRWKEEGTEEVGGRRAGKISRTRDQERDVL